MNTVRSILWLLAFTIWMWIFIFVGIGLFAAFARADEVSQAALHASHKYNVDYNLVMSVIEVESRFNPKKVGSVGEIGLMQLRPEYFPTVTFDIKNNIDHGVRYLAWLKKYCPHKDEKTFVVCYNNGPNRRVNYPKLFPYYKKVMLAYNRRLASK